MFKTGQTVNLRYRGHWLLGAIVSGPYPHPFDNDENENDWYEVEIDADEYLSDTWRNVLVRSGNIKALPPEA